ncbi:MAG: GspH/FimT family pseudopilin [Acidobacteriota bacterium]
MKNSSNALNIGRARNRGFSLLDLLVVAAVGTVVAAMAVPIIQSSVMQYRLVTTAGRVASELNAARVLAVSRGTSCSLVFGSNGSFWVVDLANPEDPAREAAQLGAGISLSSAPAQPITFFSRGYARGGTIIFSSQDGEEATVAVSPSGRTEVRN